MSDKKRTRGNKNNDIKLEMNPLLAHTLHQTPLCGIFCYGLKPNIFNNAAVKRRTSFFQYYPRLVIFLGRTLSRAPISGFRVRPPGPSLIAPTLILV